MTEDQPPSPLSSISPVTRRRFLHASAVVAIGGTITPAAGVEAADTALAAMKAAVGPLLAFAHNASGVEGAIINAIPQKKRHRFASKRPPSTVRRAVIGVNGLAVEAKKLPPEAQLIVDGFFAVDPEHEAKLIRCKADFILENPSRGFADDETAAARAIQHLGSDISNEQIEQYRPVMGRALKRMTEDDRQDSSPYNQRVIRLRNERRALRREYLEKLGISNERPMPTEKKGRTVVFETTPQSPLEQLESALTSAGHLPSMRNLSAFTDAQALIELLQDKIPVLRIAPTSARYSVQAIKPPTTEPPKKLPPPTVKPAAVASGGAGTKAAMRLTLSQAFSGLANVAANLETGNEVRGIGDTTEPRRIGQQPAQADAGDVESSATTTETGHAANLVDKTAVLYTEQVDKTQSNEPEIQR